MMPATIPANSATLSVTLYNDAAGVLAVNHAIQLPADELEYWIDENVRWNWGGRAAWSGDYEKHCDRHTYLTDIIDRETDRICGYALVKVRSFASDVREAA